MQVEVKDGKLIITMDIMNPPQPSKSGKSLLIASTGPAVRTSVMIQGKPLTVGLNAYIDK